MVSRQDLNLLTGVMARLRTSSNGLQAGLEPAYVQPNKQQHNADFNVKFQKFLKQKIIFYSSWIALVIS